MNVVELQKKLIEAARHQPQNEAVPYAFEKRIMALLKPLPTPDCWGQWAGALWRAAVPCVLLTLSLTLWCALTTPSKTSTNELSQEVDNTVMVAIDQEQAVVISE